jgi:hypothetical protein
MADIREDILARLAEVVASIPGLRSVYRNDGPIDETDLPAGIVEDGNEDTNDGSDKSQHPANKPIVVEMTPNIIILTLDPNTTEFGTLRRELISRVLNDAELNQLAKAARLGNGAIRYLGCQVGHARLRELHGAMTAQFMFTYWLKPDDL